MLAYFDKIPEFGTGKAASRKHENHSFVYLHRNAHKTIYIICPYFYICTVMFCPNLKLEYN